MSALAKIKKQAAQLEHDRQYDKALALYTRLLEASPDPDDEIDVALYNRAGDVALRAGDTARAVTYYERALDLYAAGGFLNNAIALGAKILRQAPERAATHYTLGVLHAKKGFRSDARQHFLTYAERMLRGGQGAEAARSLADYVVLCDGVADARAGLSAHLTTGTTRTGDAASKLQELLDQALRAAGLGDDEPEVEAPRTGAVARRAPDADLIFLDLDAAAIEEAAGRPDPRAASSIEPPPAEPLELLDMVDAGAAAFDTAPPPPAAPSWTPEPSAAFAAVELEPFEVAPPSSPGLPVALAGELPPLAPSMVALDGGRSDGWSAAVLTPPTESELLIPVGTPAFADLVLDAGEEADAGSPGPGLDLLDVDLPASADAGVESLAAAPEWQQVYSDLPMLPDVGDDAPSAPSLLDLELDPAPGALAAATPVRELAPPPSAEMSVGTAAEPEVPLLEPAPDASIGAPVRLDGDGLDLGAWLRDSEPAPSTRLVAPTMPTTGDEEADFRATLQAFKAGIARSLEDADFDAHYDLGVAYKEMGLLEEAIGEFQKAARAPGRPLRALEALATCFLDRGEPELVLSTLAGVAATISDEAPAAMEAPQHVALCYLLGAASQEVGRVEDARRWYLRVLATDYAFRDAAMRLASLSPPSR
jgi:tetratricopeptide (TPR) repeat protein